MSHALAAAVSSAEISDHERTWTWHRMHLASRLIVNSTLNQQTASSQASATLTRHDEASMN